METTLIYDTTLRDGTQGENINFSAEEKLKIAKKLDQLGVHYIEGGWPGSNQRDVRFFELARRETWDNALITAFGATRKPNLRVADDPNLKALINSQTPAVAVFGKSWSLHVEKVMANTREENLAMIRQSVDYLKSSQRKVIYDAEHFFDGFKDDSDYACQTLLAAAGGGADIIALCDTNGGCLTSEIETMVTEVISLLRAKGHAQEVGIHCHNDCGLAVANSIAAVQCGADMVQGTVNGYGERCGNADLISIIPLLNLKMGRSSIPDENLKHLKTVSRYVAETANMIPLHSRPFVGKSAFAHKGGIHVNAVMKTTRAYEHMDPALVGNKRRVLISDLSGKSNVEYKAREMGVEIGRKGKDCQQIVTEIKSMEDQGYQFDVADGSMKILLEKFTQQFKPLFDLESFRVSIEKEKEHTCSSHAIIKIRVNGDREVTAAEGHGPVSALDNALRKALGRFYPDLDGMRLVDFKVRVIDGREGTAARVRVFIESRDNQETWTTVGVSEDIIEASWCALADSFQFKLAKELRKHEGNLQ